MMHATCRTVGCDVEGVTFLAPFMPNVDPPVYRAECAQCGQPVTDIVP
jgi:hypothetical protein